MTNGEENFDHKRPGIYLKRPFGYDVRMPVARVCVCSIRKTNLETDFESRDGETARHRVVARNKRVEKDACLLS